MCLKDRFRDHPEQSGAVLTVLPLPPYPRGSLKRVGKRETGGVFGGLAVKLPAAGVK